PIRDDSFLLLVNAHHEDETFHLPVRRFGDCWEVEMATSADAEVGAHHDAHTEVAVESRSMLLLRRVAE
ncbi:MAG: isoamylase, partial [Solirubrobacteraceae bacterium]|nr:isoamylase [Solirubrobacteraceae bacterium]